MRDDLSVTRGQLRIYLGAAPGVGKTFAMLGEGLRRRERGADVVVGIVDTHGRPQTAAMVEDLEILPRRTLDYRGTRMAELDVDAVLRRAPDIALVDELAHTNVPGSRNEKRWQDVQDLLDAGIDVISTVNVQHLASLNDVVEKITGVPQRETVPDGVVRQAQQVELVDMTPEALRRRLAHGNVYAPEKIDAALSNYFRAGNLTALRELALLWLADTVDEGLNDYRARHGIHGTWEARERIVVALTGGPEGETLLRRAARIASRTSGGDLLAVHVTRSDGLTGGSPAELAAQRRLVESLGGSYHQVVGDDVATALLSFARAANATQLVVGVSRRRRWTRLLGGRGIGEATIADAGDIDVHLVPHALAGTGRLLPPLQGSLTRRRRMRGFLLALALPPLLTLCLVGARSSLNFTSDVLVLLLAVVVTALVGGFLPALLCSVTGSLLLNYYFAPPLHRFTISETNNALALVIFVVVGALVSSVVDLAARRTRQAARATAESETLTTMADDVLRGQTSLPPLLDRLREAFGLDGVTLLERRESGGWHAIEHAGHGEPAASPDDADEAVPVGESVVLVVRGRPLAPADRRVIGAFAVQAAAVLERDRLAAAAAAVAPLAEADRMRTALLAAVGHDLRTPLASTKAVVSSLRSTDVAWTADEVAELLLTADESLDRLTRLVDNLLDMSRLQAGALSVFPRPVALDEVVPVALDELGAVGRSFRVDVSDALPEVMADPGLLERVIVNLVANAWRYSPADHPPSVSASTLGGQVELRVTDRGPGLPEADRDRVFAPFQRLGDTDNTTGVGLGLALSRGLIEAMGGTLSPEETPGGGLTMVVSLPAVETAPLEPGRRERERQPSEQGSV